MEKVYFYSIDSPLDNNGNEEIFCIEVTKKSIEVILKCKAEDKMIKLDIGGEPHDLYPWTIHLIN